MKRPKGLLWGLSCAFLASAILRMGLGISMAEAIGTPASARETVAESCSPPLPALLEALRKREDVAATREAAIEDRLAAIALSEEVIATRMKDLQQAEERLGALVAQSSVAAEGDLQRLTSVYEAMKPKEAAVLFTNMAPDFAAGFLGRMRPETAASIMAGMPPDVAYSVSVQLAGRNAQAPTE